MARDRATILTGIWGSPDVRALPPLQQWLYLLLWTHPDTTYVGVVDWRPGRIAQLSEGSSAEFVRSLVPLLVERRFVVVDEETEELLLRPYLRHDGLLKQPKLSVSMANAYSSVASTTLRGIIIHELRRLRSEYPDYPAWSAPQVVTILKHPSIDPAPFAVPQVSPLPTGQDLALPLSLPLDEGSLVPLHTTTSTTTATSPNGDEGQRVARATTIPQPFVVSDSMLEWAASRAPLVDLRRSTERFENYWLSKSGKDATKRDWPRTWQNWMLKDQDDAERRPGAKASPAQRAANVIDMGRRLSGSSAPEVGS